MISYCFLLFFHGFGCFSEVVSMFCDFQMFAKATVRPLSHWLCAYSDVAASPCLLKRELKNLLNRTSPDSEGLEAFVTRQFRV